MRQFNQVLKVAVRESSRAAETVINNHAYAVAVGAAHATKTGDKARIEWVLGQTGKQLNYTKKGDRLKTRARGGAIIKEDSFAARIVNARRRDHAGNDFMLHGNALEAAAKKLIVARSGSIGFIASGFVRAARQLRRFAKGLKLRETPKGIKVIPGGPGGRGVPAGKGGGLFGSGQFTARVENDVVLSGGKFQAKGKSFNPAPIAEAALRVAMANEQANMLKHLKLTMEQAMKRAGAL